MFTEYKYKTELHAHTKPMSWCSEIEAKQLIDMYKELGTNSIVLTNHFIPEFFAGIPKKEGIKEYVASYNELSKYGEKANIEVILGMEIRFTENFNDYLVYGIEEKDLDIAYESLDKGIDYFYKKMKNDRNIILQAHPFRKRMILANPESIDGVEVFNMHPDHNSQIAIAARYAKEHNFLISGGTDFHHENHQGCCFIKTKEQPKNSFDIAEIIKSKDFLFDVFDNIIVPYNYIKKAEQ